MAKMDKLKSIRFINSSSEENWRNTNEKFDSFRKGTIFASSKLELFVALRRNKKFSTKDLEKRDVFMVVETNEERGMKSVKVIELTPELISEIKEKIVKEYEGKREFVGFRQIEELNLTGIDILSL